MEKSIKTILLIGGLLVVSVGGYFGYKAYKKNKDKAKTPDKKSGGTGTGSGSGGTGTGTGSGSGGVNSTSPLYWSKDETDNFLLVDDNGVSIDVPENTFLSAIDYMKNNRDVAESWGNAPYTHYREYGKAEGRKWNKIDGVSFVKANTVAAAKDYLKRYPDLAETWGGTPYGHFWLYGFNEGRTWNYNL